MPELIEVVESELNSDEEGSVTELVVSWSEVGGVGELSQRVRENIRFLEVPLRSQLHLGVLRPLVHVAFWSLP